jgi:hypothetical protein
MENKKSEGITKEDVQQHLILYPMLTNVLNEMRELSKKKQDGVLNKLKTKTINRILQKVRHILRYELTLEFLDLLDEEVLPSNSDAVLHIVQFKTAMESFEEKYYKYKDGRKIWETT